MLAKHRPTTVPQGPNYTHGDKCQAPVCYHDPAHAPRAVH